MTATTNYVHCRAPLRIAQVAPLAEAVPPKTYGGTERVVSWLTEELLDLGHDVTLFASADSVTRAKLEPCAPVGLRLAGINDHIASHLVMIEKVRRMRAHFDIVHFHTDLLQFPLAEEFGGRCLTTIHGRLDLPDFKPVYEAFPAMPLVSISDDQRRGIDADLNWLATIHHGMPPMLFPPKKHGGDYLAFLGRISPEKRPDRAIAIAKAAGLPLKIAAKVDRADRDYFEDVVKPCLDDPLIEFLGEVNEEQKAELLGGAMALLFPIDWPEPFGLVMIEAMACGAPVIAWNAGSVPEVIEHGVSGYIVDSIDSAVAAVHAAAGHSREVVRRSFERRFTSRRMAEQYVCVYEQLIMMNTAHADRPKPAHSAHRSASELVQRGDSAVSLPVRQLPGGA